MADPTLPVESHLTIGTGELPSERLGEMPPPRPIAIPLPEEGPAAFAEQVQALLAEIRRRISELNEREAAVEAHEQELRRRFSGLSETARQTAATDLHQAQERLDAHTARLNEQAVELVKRGQALDDREQQLLAEAARLESQRAAQQQAGNLLAGQVAAFQAARERERKTLLERISRVRNQQQELERRIGLARNEIVQQRAALEARRTELVAQAAALTAEQQRFHEQEEALARRLAHSQAREAEHAQRATELQAERTALDGQRVALEHDARALADQQRQLEARVSAAAERLRQADVREQDAREEQQKTTELLQRVEERRARLVEAQREHDKRTAALTERIRGFRQEQEAYAAELERVRNAEATLASRRAAALAEVRRRRAAFEAQIQAERTALETEQRNQQATLAAEGQARRAALDAELQGRRETVEAELRGLRESAEAELRRRRQKAEAAWQAQEARVAGELRSRSEAVAKELSAQQAEHAARLTAERESATAEIAAQRTAAQAEVAALRAAVQAELDAQRARAEAEWQARLAATLAELDAREASLRSQEAASAQAAAEAAEHRESALRLREQAENRDAESRATALSIEVERQAIEQERRALSLAADELDTLRARRDSEYDELRRQLAGESERLTRAQATWFAGPRRWWLRTSLLAGAAGVAAAFGWLSLEPPRFQARALLAITPQAPDRANAVIEHRNALLRPDALDGEAPGSAWAVAFSENRITAMTHDQPAGVEWRLAGSDAHVAQALLSSALESYMRRVQEQRERAVLPPDMRALAAARDELAEPLADLSRRSLDVQARLAILPDAEVYERLVEELRELQTQLGRNHQELNEQRAALSLMMAEALPTGTVSPGLLEATLAADEIYNEDTTELRNVALQYRSELSVALLMLFDPVKDAGRALEKFADLLTEQGNLNPPPPVLAVVEQISGATAGLLSHSGTAAARLHQVRADLEQVNIDLDAAPLVLLQNEADKIADELVAAFRRALEDMRTRLDDLAASTDGKPREVVVATVLRGEISVLDAAALRLEEAARHVDARSNFQIDTFDRQLRGLRMRREQRREALRQQLQAEADAIAQLTRRESLEQVRTVVRELETQREQLAAGLVDRVEALRRTDEARAQRATHAAELAALTAEAEWRRARLAEVEARLTAAGAAAQPDQLTLSPVTLTDLTPGRYRHAVMAGLAGFVCTVLLSVLLLVRAPGRPPAPALV